jgi:hypothetical protein
MLLYKCKYKSSSALKVWHAEFDDERYENMLSSLPAGTKLAERVMITEHIPYGSQTTELLQNYQSGNVL